MPVALKLLAVRLLLGSCLLLDYCMAGLLERTEKWVEEDMEEDGG